MATTINLTHVPTDDQRAKDKSTVIGCFEYPARAEFDDEGEYADACANCEAEVRQEAAQMLNDHFIDTTHAEIRLSEFIPGEIRVYW